VNSSRNSSRLLKVLWYTGLSLLLQYEEVKEVVIGVLRRDKQNTKYSRVRYVYCILTVNDKIKILFIFCITIFGIPILRLLPQNKEVRGFGVGVLRKDERTRRCRASASSKGTSNTQNTVQYSMCTVSVPVMVRLGSRRGTGITQL